jgi:glutaminase
MQSNIDDLVQQNLGRENIQELVSTGKLPPRAQLEQIVNETYALVKTVDNGQNAQHYPALARVPRDLFGICLAGISGETYAVGDADVEFTIMSVAKPFIFALVCEALGAAQVRAQIGVNATGLPFNSVMAVELHPDHLTNPMVNSGAIATTSLAPGTTVEEKWQFIQAGLARFAGRTLSLNEEVYASAMESNHRNRGIAQLLQGFGHIYDDPIEAVDLYTRQSSLNVTVKDLAIMSATLAGGGVNPISRTQVISARHCKHTLAVMATAGLYETSGDWLYTTGVPGKSGVSGGIITVAPGKGGLATFAPPLDSAGNSVKGQLVAQYLSDRLGLNLFASQPMQSQPA